MVGRRVRVRKRAAEKPCPNQTSRTVTEMEGCSEAGAVVA